MKVSQTIEKKLPGRPKEASGEELLRYEGLWVDTFRGLRDGNPEGETEIAAVPSMFIKRSGAGQEQLYIEGFGKPPRLIRQQKFSTTPDELRTWRSRVQKEHDQFEEAMLNPAPFSATATAALPSGSLGISDANALREVWTVVTLSRGGMMLSRAKNPKLSTGRKNKNTSHNGSRADLSRHDSKQQKDPQ